MKLYYTAQDVAHKCNVSPATVRLWADCGKLRIAATTPRGMRLFTEAAVDKMAEQRNRHGS